MAKRFLSTCRKHCCVVMDTDPALALPKADTVMAGLSASALYWQWTSSVHKRITLECVCDVVQDMMVTSPALKIWITIMSNNLAIHPWVQICWYTIVCVHGTRHFIRPHGWRAYIFLCILKKWEIEICYLFFSLRFLLLLSVVFITLSKLWNMKIRSNCGDDIFEIWKFDPTVWTTSKNRSLWPKLHKLMCSF